MERRALPTGCHRAWTCQKAIQSGYTFSEPTVEVTEDLANCDLDGDGITDDVDTDTTDFCVSIEDSDACVAGATTAPLVTQPPIVDVMNPTTTTTTTTTATVPQPGTPDPGTPTPNPSRLSPTG